MCSAGAVAIGVGEGAPGGGRCGRGIGVEGGGEKRHGQKKAVSLVEKP